MESWKDYFYYSKAERRGIVVLLTLVLFSIFLPKVYSLFQKEQPSKDYRTQLAILQEKTTPVEPPSYRSTQRTKGSQKSLSKKNRYKQKPPQVEKRQVFNAPKTNESDSTPENDQEVQEKENIVKAKPVKVKTVSPIAINKATAEEFAQLRGIGEVLSNRIVKFRTKLGGFTSVAQLSTTYGLKPEVFTAIKPQLKLENTEVKKHNFNTETAEQLSAHPYISKKFAQQIVNYREKVSPYKSFDDVQKLYYFKNQPELFIKLKPYISF